LVVLTPDVSLLTVAKTLASRHAHRIVIAGPDGLPLNIISQTDIVRTIAEHKASLPKADMPIRESSLASSGTALAAWVTAPVPTQCRCAHRVLQHASGGSIPSDA
jgi:hypothetical protein